MTVSEEVWNIGLTRIHNEFLILHFRNQVGTEVLTVNHKGVMHCLVDILFKNSYDSSSL